MKILSVVGARPQFVKLAPVAAELAVQGHEHVVVHTGQHYDDAMSKVFFDDLSIDPPDVDLGVGSGTHGVQTGAMLVALDAVLEAQQPDWILVYGDTNSTLAGALSAVKLHLPVAHLEAGLRSFNRRMPEEHNRVLTDHAADLLLAPSTQAMKHLSLEGLAERSRLVGDVMVDVLIRVRDEVVARPLVLANLPTEEPYVVATIHRPDNTDHRARLEAIIDALASLGTPVVLAAHPRLVARATAYGIELDRPTIRVLPPLPYPHLVASVMGAVGVVTDSGGLQKEAFVLGVPCTTVRTETEWPETLDADWNVLVTDPNDLSSAVSRPPPQAPRGTPYGDGRAAASIVAALANGEPPRR